MTSHVISSITIHRIKTPVRCKLAPQTFRTDLCSAVYLNGDIRDLFTSTVGVRQRCLLSPTLFTVFLERIMTDALEDHQRTVSIGGRTITILRFSDGIDGLAGKGEDT